MVINPGVQFKPVERDPLSTDRDFSEVGPDVGIEPVAVHAEVARCVPEAQQPRDNGCQPRRFLDDGDFGISAQGRRP